MLGGKEFQFFATEYLNVDWPIALFTLSLKSLLCMHATSEFERISQLAREVQVVQYLENTYKA
jgi:hypothetical protein